ncbi:hypothetical protein BV898_00467 [Hypsibius exemplaris]|uniref:RING-type domain-containing protein n=1 Tax=Hypsibius exemplaris TaxID=2072580 RepID=A0A1W0XDP5_HYPEX|nr:hypothetical protein BV898_00467 [Hypsibius exemplaris]
MDWLHCNVCYLRPQKQQDIEKLVTSNCGHVFCRSCAATMKEGKCHQCQNPCRIVSLDANMPAEIAIFFKNTAQSLKKAMAAHKETGAHLAGFQQAKQFQDTQHEHLMAFLSSMAQRPSSPPGTVRISTEQYQQWEVEKNNYTQTVMMLQKELSQLKAALQQGQARSGIASMPGNHMMSPAPGRAGYPSASSAMIVGQMAPQPHGSRILQSRAAVYVPPTSSKGQPAREQEYVLSKSRMQMLPPSGQVGRALQQPQQQYSSRESLVGGYRTSAQQATSGRQGATTPYQRHMAAVVRPSSTASDSSMRSSSTVVTNRSSGIARTVFHHPHTMQQEAGGSGSRVSSGSSRLVAGPTYRPSDSFQAKRYKS